MRTVRQLLDGKAPSVFTVNAEDPVRAAIQMMADHFIGALPVMQGGRLAATPPRRRWARP